MPNETIWFVLLGELEHRTSFDRWLILGKVTQENSLDKRDKEIGY